jgi:hypothetical protein
MASATRLPLNKAVFVETISPIGTAEPGITGAIDITPALLSRNAFDSELRVSVPVFAQDRVWVY